LKNARTYLNDLKINRLEPDFYTEEVARVETMDKDALIAEIMDERFRELAFESHRWFDLRRTTQKEIIHSFGDETATLQQGDARYTLRFPVDAVSNNSNLNNW